MASNNVTVHLHIGLHKTGTTSLQDFLSRMSLRKEGFCWPGFEGHGKSLSSIPLTILSSNKYPANQLTALENCFKSNLSVILSAEDFSVLNLEKIRVLKNTIIQTGERLNLAISFHVIMVYREPLTRLYSNYCERARSDRITGTLDFLNYTLAHSEDKAKSTYAMTALDRYEEIFGRDKITIVDYDGVMAANQSLVHTIVCSTMKIFCNDQNHHEPMLNEKANMIHLHLLYMMNLEIKAHGYHLCGWGNKLTSLVSPQFKLMEKDIPVRRVNLRSLWTDFHQADKKFRHKYGSVMIYNNKTAAVEALKSLEVEEIDEVAFHRPTWLKFLSSELQRLSLERKICDTAGKPTNFTTPNW